MNIYSSNKIKLSGYLCIMDTILINVHVMDISWFKIFIYLSWFYQAFVWLYKFAKISCLLNLIDLQYAI